MVNFNILSEADCFAKDNVDEEIKNTILMLDWNNEQEMERIRNIVKPLLSHAYYHGAKNYYDLYSHAKEECLSLRGQLSVYDKLISKDVVSDKKYYVNSYGNYIGVDEVESEHTVFSGTKKECEEYIDNLYGC